MYKYNKYNMAFRRRCGHMRYTSTESRVLAKYPCPVEWSLLVLDVPGLQHAASLGAESGTFWVVMN